MQTFSLLAIGLISAFTVPAQDPQFGPGSGRGRLPRGNAGFSTLDLNGDGILDATEIQAAPKSLAKLDKNQDGQITSDEVRMAMPPGRGPGGPRREREGEGGATANIVEDTVKTLMSFDSNGDGKLSRTELPERFQGIFNRGDENKDGYLTAEEIRKVAATHTAAPDSAGSGGRSGPDGGRGDGPRGQMNFILMDPIFAAVDTNRDGVLSVEEIRSSADAIKKLVKNGKGTITRDDLMPSPPQRDL